MSNDIKSSRKKRLLHAFVFYSFKKDRPGIPGTVFLNINYEF